MAYIYILMNESNKVLYTGVTNDLIRRVWEHKENIGSEFTRKYHVRKLVYFEQIEEICTAINREKQIKSWKRTAKIELIRSKNPEMKDLYDDILN